MALVVMGVCGCGKSTVAGGIAAALGLACVDGDDLHDPDSVRKMASGQALQDDDRWPWLERVGARLNDAAQSPAGLVVACSALKRSYRQRIRHAAPGVRFLFLDGSPERLRQRLADRADHFMPLDLLASQLATLERPGRDEPDVLTLDIEAPVQSLVNQAIASLRNP